MTVKTCSNCIFDGNCQELDFCPSHAYILHQKAEPTWVCLHFYKKDDGWMVYSSHKWGTLAGLQTKYQNSSNNIDDLTETIRKCVGENTEIVRIDPPDMLEKVKDIVISACPNVQVVPNEGESTRDH